MSIPDATIALNRFGLGARPGEIKVVAGDPRGWLMAQLTPEPAPPAPVAALPSALRGRMIGINENLAREILELHTLGVRSGYTQADVTSFAKILTGWLILRPGRPETGQGESRAHRAHGRRSGPGRQRGVPRQRGGAADSRPVSGRLGERPSRGHLEHTGSSAPATLRAALVISALTRSRAESASPSSDRKAPANGCCGSAACVTPVIGARSGWNCDPRHPPTPAGAAP